MNNIRSISTAGCRAGNPRNHQDLCKKKKKKKKSEVREYERANFYSSTETLMNQKRNRTLDRFYRRGNELLANFTFQLSHVLLDDSRWKPRYVLL
jgi:hypothetical protein